MAGFVANTNNDPSGSDIVYASNVDFSGQANPKSTMITNGQLLIGSTSLNAGNTHINVGTLTSPDGSVTIGYSSPNITLQATGGSMPASQTELFDDFIWNQSNAIAGAGSFPFYWTMTGTWTKPFITNHPGVMTWTSTSASATASVISANGGTTYGPAASYYGITYEIMHKLDVLSAANPSYRLSIGCWNDGSADPSGSSADGYYFRYNHAVNGGQWQIVTSSATVATVNNTASLVDTNWHRYTIQINAAGTSVAFFIDGVQVTNSPITTNIPKTSQGLGIGINSLAGATQKSFNIDYFYSKFTYTR